jgi:hypothetical protein
MIKQIQAVYTWYSTRSKQEKILLYASAVFIFIAFLDRAVVGPIYKRSLELDKAIVDKQAAIKLNMKILAQEKTISKRKAEYSGYSVAETTPEQDTNTLFKEVDDIASKLWKNGVDIKPQQEAQKEKEFKKYQVNIICEAPFDKLIEFMYNIENSRKVLKIEKFTLSLKSKNDTALKCTMTVSKVVLSEDKTILPEGTNNK